MSKRFANRVYVVTGSTQGVGEAIALALAEGGAAGVVVTGRSAERGQRVTAALEQAGTRALFVPAALEREEDCRALLAACDKQFGRVDGLVNAAGTTERGNIEDTTAALWDRIFAINTRAPFLLCQAAVRLMRREGRGGAIVNVSSMSSYGGQPFLLPYCASKGALNVMTKNLANALRADRIRVNVINLGWTDTPGEHAIQKATGAKDGWLEDAEARQPFGRLVKPKDVADLAAFLLSDAAEMMTGACVDLDQNVMGAYG